MKINEEDRGIADTAVHVLFAQSPAYDQCVSGTGIPGFKSTL